VALRVGAEAGLCAMEHFPPAGRTAEVEQARRRAGMTISVGEEILTRARELGLAIRERVRRAQGADACHPDRSGGASGTAEPRRR
jgi:hypothetical protein